MPSSSAKQAIIGIIQDVIGEWVSNLPKEKLKVALVRGKITLEDVQLDGDIIGSHVLGTMGLSGFGVLSCSARRLRISIPWGSLEKTPTRCEIQDVHLICVPLLPSNANRMCGAGTPSDPRCTLRTRAKRAALARYERNFFSGRILGEGPMKNKNRRVELKRQSRVARMSKGSSGGALSDMQCSGSVKAEGNSAAGDVNEVEPRQATNTMMTTVSTTDMRNSLKMKLQASAFRNIEASISRIHIRCEIAEGSLVGDDETVIGITSEARSDRRKESARTAKNSFAFGVTLESLLIKTATPQWETGYGIFNDEGKINVGGPLRSGPTFKLVELNECQIYWDDDPRFLISETRVLKEAHDVPPNKIQKKVAMAMEIMRNYQDPGEKIRESLSIRLNRRETSERDSGGDGGGGGSQCSVADAAQNCHSHCCLPFSLRFRVTFSDPTQEGPSHWKALLEPFEIHLRLSQQQFWQYRDLRQKMLSIRRADTMLHKRPKGTPSSDPRSWWQYAVNCVVARPNARPWNMVCQIIRCRSRYIELVKKKLLADRFSDSCHIGLSKEDITELISLQDHLPIETLLSFHLLALRDVYRGQMALGKMKKCEESLNSLLSSIGTPSNVQNSRSRSSIQRITRKHARAEKLEAASVSSSGLASESYSHDDSLIFLTFELRQVDISLSLVDSNSARAFMRSEFEASGSIFSSGRAANVKEVKLDLKRVTIDSFDSSSTHTHHRSKNILAVSSNSGSLELPGGLGNSDVDDAVCHLVASRDINSTALAFSARPATLVWDSALFERVMSFLSSDEKTRETFKARLRKAATPLAYKAQVAMRNTNRISVEILMDAPKVWMPIAVSGVRSPSEGAIYFDAGVLKLSMTKEEGVEDASTVASMNQVNVKYCDNVSGFFLNEEGLITPSESQSEVNTKAVQVVQPFSIDFAASIVEDYDDWDRPIASFVDSMQRNDPCRYVNTYISIAVSDIRLDLLDAEILAKVIGKIYANGIIRAKTRVKQEDGEVEEDTFASRNDLSSESIALAVTLNKIEVACSSSDGRKYLLELRGMEMKHASLNTEKLSTFAVNDVCATEGNQGQTIFHSASRTSTSRHSTDESADNSEQSPCKLMRAFFRRDEDEIEINFQSFCFLLTPTSLVDCLHGIAVLADLAELMTREVEKQIHSKGRRSRGERKKMTMSPRNLDSTLLVTLNINTLTMHILGSTFESSSGPQPLFSFVTNALIMFQSIESNDADATGMRTLHISFDGLSAFVSHSLGNNVVDLSTMQRIVEPCAAECRLAYVTHNFGCVVSQNFSFLLESLAVSMAPSSIIRLKNIVNSISQSLASAGILCSVGSRGGCHTAGNRKHSFSVGSLIKYKKSGAGIATSLQLELVSSSFIVLRPDQTQKPVLECSVEGKLRLKGCMSALFGDASFNVSMNHLDYSLERNELERSYIAEPFTLTTTIEQIPNEIIISATAGNVCLNITSGVLRDIADINISKGACTRMIDQNISKVALDKHASRGMKQIRVVNDCGCGMILCPMNCPDSTSSSSSYENIIVDAGESVSIEFRELTTSFVVGLSDSVPVESCGGTRGVVMNLVALDEQRGSRTAHTMRPPDNTDHSSAKPNHDFEPVVEWCLQNQRLRSEISDVYSIAAGEDLLSSSQWSPGEKRTQSCWVRPYLDDDCPEWTDLSGTLRLARERVLLPNDSWIWASDWEAFRGDENQDIDGWEYEAEFDLFTRSRRFYKSGDAVRRRRWCRTRITRPPRLDDRSRPINFVCEFSRLMDDTLSITLQSPLTLRNSTSQSVAIFLYNTSWEQDVHAADVPAGKNASIPIYLASATYMRVAQLRDKCALDDQERLEIESYYYSDRVLILSPRDEASTLRKACIWGIVDGKKQARVHFNVAVCSSCSSGIVETQISIDPIAKIVNLLPCVLSYRVGEKRAESNSVARRGHREDILVDIAGGSECNSIDPMAQPHISINLPGLSWSSWKQIVNRKLSSLTWQPSEQGREGLLKPEGECDIIGDYQAVVELLREEDGMSFDGLTIIMSVESGHCPVIRFFAQYWILDRTALGLRFTEGLDDVVNGTPNKGTLRRSHGFERNEEKRGEWCIFAGYQWCVGYEGMTMYFSRKKQIAISIMRESDSCISSAQSIMKSEWCSPISVATLMPKNMITLLDDAGGRHELSLRVELCPLSPATKLIYIDPHYKIVNNLRYGILIAQDGCLDKHVFIASTETVPFHWADTTLPSKVRLCAQDAGDEDEIKWTNGSIALDKVGLTSIRMNVFSPALSRPEVVQIDIRLARKAENAAVLVVISHADAQSKYTIRNLSSRTILVTQPLDLVERKNIISRDENNFEVLDTSAIDLETTTLGRKKKPHYSGASAVCPGLVECGVLGSCIGSSFDSFNTDKFNTVKTAYVWTIMRGCETYFGFDNPDKPPFLEWACTDGTDLIFQDSAARVGYINIDAMGSSSKLTFPDGREVACCVKGESSSICVQFFDVRGTDPSSILGNFQGRVGCHKTIVGEDGKMLTSATNTACVEEEEDCEFVILTLRLDLDTVGVSVIDAPSRSSHSTSNIGREILFFQFDSMQVEFGQSRRGYHEVELQVASLQVDNHIHSSTHPVMVYCPSLSKREPFLHFSVVRKLDESSIFFPYVALRILPVHVNLDRRAIEVIGAFIQPLIEIREGNADPKEFVICTTTKMSHERSKFLSDDAIPTDFIASRRVYIEKMILHPVRLSLTFTQQGLDDPFFGPNSSFVVTFFRSLASISSAPLTFTSFVVGHLFEYPISLARIVATHYTSQLYQQIFAVLGSLAIFTVPADLLQNIGTGVVSFFYEPAKGLVMGPSHFIEGIEAGTSSLVRGIFVGVAKSAANVTDLVNNNLARLASDDAFIDERRKSARSNRHQTQKTLSDSLHLAGASLARSVRSGAVGIVEQPSLYLSKHGPIGFAKGVAKACVGAVVKPMVGLGDATVLVLAHVSENEAQVLQKRKRRALAQRLKAEGKHINLVPFDETAGDAQNIVTEIESTDDIYLGHVQTRNSLFIFSERRFFVLKGHASAKRTDIWQWEDISHFVVTDTLSFELFYFSPKGIKMQHYEVASSIFMTDLCDLLVANAPKTANGVYLTPQEEANGFVCKRYTFGKGNVPMTRINDITVNDEVEMLQNCSARLRNLKSNNCSTSFCSSLDLESWTLIDQWSNLVSGLRSRRCLVVGIINGTSTQLQIKTAHLLEGGSLCYSCSTKEYDDDQGLLAPGGAIIFFLLSKPPSLVERGNVYLNLETNMFSASLAEDKEIKSSANSRNGYRLIFLEKSYDPAGWWAKYWLLCQQEAETEY